MREKGIVKKYIEDRGFGFIRRADGKRDVFFHVNQVCAEDPSSIIAVNSLVEFTVVEEAKGPRAVDVLML
jgi:cold shock CspA family protein